MEMRQLPMGCYFSPKPYECINFLSLKVHGSEDSSCSWGGLIFDCDPYNPKQLPDIFSTVETRDNLYFFAKLRRKGKIGSVHIDRTIVGFGENKGTWHADQTKEVRDADDVSVIGSARTFTFWGKKGDANNRRFLMTEYQLLPSNGNGDGHDSAALHYDPLKDHVLCHLRCAPEGKGKKATKSINNLKMPDCAPPLQSLLPQPLCPAAISDITAEAFPSCSVIGSARTFTFWGKKDDTNNRRFLMTEYQLLPCNGNGDGDGDGHDSAALHYDPLKDHVLCHLRCAPEGKGKGKKATKSINNLKMFDCALPLQSLPPQPPCPAANSDFTAEAFPSCFTTPAAEFASPAYSLQTPTDSPIDPALASFLADTDLITKDWDDITDAQLDDTDFPMDWVDLDLLMGTTGNDEDVLPPSSAAPLHIQNDDPLALISVAAVVNPNSSLEPEFPSSYSTSVDNYSSSYRHDVERPSVFPLANTTAIPSPGLLPNPVAVIEDDYDIVFDTLPPINFQSQSNDLNWDGMSEFVDREELISCYNHPIFHELN